MIIDHLDPQDIYSLLLVEPPLSLAQSSTRDICFSYNIRFGGMSILTIAIEEHDVVTVKGILEVAAALAETSREKPGPVQYAPHKKWYEWLLAAVHLHYIDIVEIMLNVDDVTAHINESGCIDELLFDTIAWHGNKRVINLLIEKGANTNAIDFEGLTPLNRAAKENNTYAVRTLLKTHHANCNVTDVHGFTALYYAIQNYNPHMMKLLLENGAMMNIEDKTGDSPLRIVQKMGNGRLLELLRQYGADPNSQVNSTKPLGLSAQFGRQKSARMLRRDAQTGGNSRGTSEYTPFMEAICSRDKGTIQAFMESALLNLNAKNASNETPLHVAIFNDKTLKTAKLLLKTVGLLVDEKDDRGMTPLMYVLSSMTNSPNKPRHMSFMTKLLSTGEVDLNGYNSRGESVLQCAIRTKHAEVVKLLLHTGEIYITPDDVHLAYSCQDLEISEMVSKAWGYRGVTGTAAC
jgi:ankyrin repeat protein